MLALLLSLIILISDEQSRCTFFDLTAYQNRCILVHRLHILKVSGYITKGSLD